MRAAVAGVLALLAVAGCGWRGGEGPRKRRQWRRGPYRRAALPSVTPAGRATAARPRCPTPSGMACATSTVKAERLPLDVYLMLDASYSMLDPTAVGGQQVGRGEDGPARVHDGPAVGGHGPGAAGVPPGALGDPRGLLPGRHLRRLRAVPDREDLLARRPPSACARPTPAAPSGRPACRWAAARRPSYCAPVDNTCGPWWAAPRLGNSCEQIPGYCIARDLCDAARLRHARRCPSPRCRARRHAVGRAGWPAARGPHHRWDRRWPGPSPTPRIA